MAAVALAVLAAPSIAPAADCGSERCHLFRSAAGASGPLAPGPDGALWFAGDGFAGRMTVDGHTTRFPAPLRSGAAVAGGVDGAVWFSVGDGRVARVAPDGAVSLRPTGLTIGPAALAGASDGAMWFTAGRTVGWVTVGGRDARYQLSSSGTPVSPPGSGGPGSMAQGSDGAMWVAEASARVHRISPAGAISTFTLGGFASIGGLVAGPDGGVWLTLPTSKQIARISPATGHITLYRTSQRPAHIAAGPSHSVWFTMRGFGPQSIVRMTPAGFQTFFQMRRGARGLAIGANGGVFATEGVGIERLTPFLGARPIRTRALLINRFAGSAALRLFCPKFDLVYCAGRVSLTYRGRFVGGAPFSQRVNDAPATRLLLNARGRALMRARARVRVRMTIVQHDQGGTQRRSTQNLYLRR
ncbi:MAG: virginiamycin lyase [Solirubrobacteraceae bacterium]|nr:virginiamycin lyase [Solirubrobacteraceae bacterium]